VDICAAFYRDGEESATSKLQEKHKKELEEAFANGFKIGQEQFKMVNRL
jgi:hypothetical protein